MIHKIPNISSLFVLGALLLLLFVGAGTLSAQTDDDFLQGENIFDTPSVDLKVNGSDGPVNVAIGERITISWESDGAKRCRGNWSKKDLRLNGKIAGKLSRSVVSSVTVRIACIDGDGNRKDDSVLLEVSSTSAFPTPTSTEQLRINLKNNGLGSALYIEWNPVIPKPSSYALTRAKIDGGNLSPFEIIPTVSNTKGNFAIDYNVERGVTYEYRVIPIYGNSFSLDGIEKVSGARITADFVPTKSEKILFVIPQKYLETRKDISQIIPSLIDGINFIYSSTQRQFSFAGIKTYNPDICVNGCENVLGDSKYYEPGAMVVYAIPGAITSGYTIQGTPPTIILGNESLNLANPNHNLNSDSGFYSSLVQTLAHEIAHTYGVAIPEYYVYPNAIDNSGISPTIPAVSLASNYQKDVMYTYQNNYKETSFGPLSIHIINANPYHSDMRFRSGQPSDIRQILPSQIAIKVSDSGSRPIVSSKVDVYCIQAEDPRYKGLHQQLSLIKSLSTDISGEVSFMLDNQVKQLMFAGKCHVLGLKVSKKGLVASANYITELQLQEEKVLNGSDKFLIQFSLSEN